ncbi:hypothetical protein CONLIGDRAFT_645529 [Coniochaeta ligniaria NRRL 30616]|uniref:K Homology domain-containing protein n=1 Tax=Coniochaeta ligniaria NRRL 30616 TaxID=1408157 RepID=A0A1J7JHY8_9PEZI|nr:hypothetical protein CONLIGDRAFT_645529 [Coniochaeta ligniaria NRRL 30616]
MSFGWSAGDLVRLLRFRIEPGEICKAAKACREAFTRCLSNPTFSELDWFENRQAEFNLWIASLKATRTGKTSLDHRVREYPEVRGLICDLLAGLLEALEGLLTAAEPKDSAPTQEIETESPDDGGSVFSGFSTDGRDTDSLPNIGKDDGPFSEQMFNIKTVLTQLVRISTAIRRSGVKHRYRKADESLNEEDHEDFKNHLTVLITMSSLTANAEEEHDSNAIQHRLTDLTSLTEVQKRLVHVNVLRRNRIIFATRSMTPVEAPRTSQPARRPITAAEVPHPQMESKQISNAPPSVQRQAPSTKAPSISQTATEIGSQFDVQQAVGNKRSTPSVVTRVTRVGASQDYPRCPQPIFGELLCCPYCADLLPTTYSKNQDAWKGHVAQDILPYSCIYHDCKTPDEMYLTSEALFNHMRGQHGVVRWVCDYCNSKEAVEPAFLFNSLEDWEFHMTQRHATFPESRLRSLEKVSQRRVLEPLACPLCGYTAEQPHSTLDIHVAQHLHEFALRCLPWGTCGNEEDSVEAKSANDSHSTEPDDESDPDYDDPYLDLMEAHMPTPKELEDALVNCFNHMSTFFPRDKNFPQYRSWLDRLTRLKRRLADAEPLSQLRAEELAKQESRPSKLIDCLASTGSFSPSEQSRMRGKLPSYTIDSSSKSPTPRDIQSEIIHSHLLKLSRILGHACYGKWSAKHPQSAFELYAEKARPISQVKGKQDSGVTVEELTQRWNDLAKRDRERYEEQSKKAKKILNDYMTRAAQGAGTMIEDELTALEVVLSDGSLESASVLASQPQSPAPQPLFPPLLEDQLLESYCGVGDGVDTERSGRFIPRGTLEQLITKDIVVETLANPPVDDMDSEQIRGYAERICHAPGLDEHAPTYRKLFAILILIGRPEDIVLFIRHGVDDSKLPLISIVRPGTDRTVYLCLQQSPQHPLHFLKQWSSDDCSVFDREQWAMIAPYFAKGNGGQALSYELHEKAVLPWIRVNRYHDLRQSYHVTNVEIHPHHHEFHDYLLSDGTFALRRLESGGNTDIVSEVEAWRLFSGDRGHPNLVSLLTTFKKGDDHHLLFHWAESNLLAFWGNVVPGDPLLFEHLCWLIRQCRDIAGGVRHIHEVIYDPESSMIPAGFHWAIDINPDNLLVYKKRDDSHDRGTIMLTNYCHCFSRRALDLVSEMDDSRFLLSPKYGPPDPKISSSSDIWSLGCVYLEFITWYLGGWDYVVEFWAMRQSEELDQQPDFDSGPRFFDIVTAADGEPTEARVKSQVVTWISVLRSHECCSEPIHLFLDLILNSMLVVEGADSDSNPLKRATSSEVYKRLDDIYNMITDPSFELVPHRRDEPPPPPTDPTGVQAEKDKARWSKRFERSDSRSDESNDGRSDGTSKTKRRRRRESTTYIEPIGPPVARPVATIPPSPTRHYPTLTTSPAYAPQYISLREPVMSSVPRSIKSPSKHPTVIHPNVLVQSPCYDNSPFYPDEDHGYFPHPLPNSRGDSTSKTERRRQREITTYIEPMGPPAAGPAAPVPPSPARQNIVGQAPDIEKAKESIQGLVKEHAGETVQVPNKLYHAISNNGQFLRRLRYDYDVKVDHADCPIPKKPSPPTANALGLITDDEDNPNDVHSFTFFEVTSAEEGDIPWVLRGSPENVEKAKKTIEAALKQAAGQNAIGYLTLPGLHTYKHVLGRGASKITSIRKQSGCTIIVPRDQGDAIEIIGSRKGIENAKELILAAVREDINDRQSME